MVFIRGIKDIKHFMEKEQTYIQRTKKIGQYLSCDLDTINQGLEQQQQLASQGTKNLLGEILIDLRAIIETS